MALSIKSITIKDCVPLYDVAPSRKCYFSNDSLQLYGPQKVPAAAISTTKYQFTVAFDNFKPEGRSIQATLNKTPIVMSFKQTSATALVTFSWSSRPIPWSLVGRMVWTVSDKNEENWKELLATDIELYVLGAVLPSHIVSQGLSVGLLRQEKLFTAWMKSSVIEWGKFVVNALFNDYQMCYEVTSGAATYTSVEVNGSNIKVTSWIDLWVSDMDGLKDRNDTKTRYAVNCYDLATLAYSIISLGLPDHSKLQLKVLDPVGYIKTTKLIGRGWCNNPLFEKSEEQVLDAFDERRKPFGHHMFVARFTDSVGPNPWIYDACCGPEDGHATLSVYLSNLVDTSAGLYGLGKAETHPGKAEDVHEVETPSFSRPLSFEQRLQPPLNSTWKTIFELMRDCFPAAYFNVLTPFVGSPGGKSYVVATWTVIRTQQDFRRMSINIYCFEDKGKSANEYKRRKRDLPNPKEAEPTTSNEIGNHLECNLNTGALYMFHARRRKPQEPPNQPVVQHDDEPEYLVTLESDTMRVAELSSAASLIKGLVIDKTQDYRSEVAAIEVPTTAVKVNTTFEIKVVPTEVGVPQPVDVPDGKNPPPKIVFKAWWRGYAVEALQGCALLMESRVANDNTVTFTFLARRQGSETLQIRLYGPQLVVRQSTANVTIIA